MKKRVLSMLMALALCLTLLPTPVWAEETENNIAAQANTANVAEVTINGKTTPYTDIDAAFAAAQQAGSATVKLLADVTISHDDYSGIALKKGNITLDLNGKTLSKSTRDDSGFFARNAVFWLSPPGATTNDEFLAALKTPVRLTVQDSSADGNGKIVQPNGGPAVIATLNTILTVNGGTIENASSVDFDDDSHMKPNCAVLLSGGGKAVINGGTLSGMRGVAVTGYITKETEGLYKQYYGIDGYNNDTYGNELTVTGGNICGTSGEALIVYEKAKKIELSGGIFTTQSNAYSIWVADTEAEGEPTIKGDASSRLASGYRYEYIVVAHKHSPKYTEIDDPNDPEHTYRYICECGFVCPHNSFTHSICDTCHTACTHDVCDSEGRCLLCDAQSAVLVKYIDNIGLTSTKPYMKTTDQDGNDVTLQQVFDEAKDGSTVTLLVDGLRASGEVTGKTITLDLNGKRLIETSNGIRVDPNSTLKVTGSGSIAANISVGAKGTLDLSGWTGGTINTVGLSNNGTDESTLTVGENAGTIRDLEILNWPSERIAKTKLRGGSYNKILITMKSGTGADKTIPYSSMLAEGYAFQYVDSKEFVDYAAAAQYSNGDGSISDVKVVKCPHAKINEDGHCAYCNATGFVAQVTAADGSSSAYTDIAAAIAAAGGGTVKLLANASEITINSPLKLDLNGKTAAKLTVTGNVTLASLLPEGYTFKSGSTWISDLSGTELTNVSMAKIPIKSMDYPTEMSMTYGGAGTLLVKVEKESGTGAVSFQWYKVEDGNETAVGSATAKNQFDLSAQNLSAGQHTFRFSATCDGYEKMSEDIAVTVQKASIGANRITPPPAQENLTYTGQEQELITAGSVTSGGTMQYSLTENGTYSPDIPTGTDAGAYTVWYRVIGDANHKDTAPASVAVRIGQKPLTITGVTVAPKLYDGTTNADITSVTFDNVTLKRDTDYNVTASFDYASVDSGKNVTATVTLMGQAAKNYALEQSSFPTTGSITKAAVPDFTKETALVIINGYEKTYTVTLPTLPTLETHKEYGTLTYEIGEIKLNDGYYTGGAKVENGELTLPIQKNDVETTGSVGTVTVVIKSANYEDITLTVNVSAKNRITPTGTPTLSKNAIIYGDALNTIALSGKLHDNVNNVDVDGTFEWVDGTHIPVVGNGTYAAEWIFEPTDTEKYLTVSGRSNITVEKATQYGKVSMAGYKATAYIRLSYTDDHSSESDSVSNQRKLIENFVEHNPDIEVVSEKIDDGYSGIIFDRPAFKEMMQDVTDGNINCVIVKDLSRLGREYIETGRYLRRVFPAYGVRFIAITDSIDTAHDSGDDLTVSVKNIMNEAYCRDISIKTRSSLDVKRRNGDFVGAFPVYG